MTMKAWSARLLSLLIIWLEFLYSGMIQVEVVVGFTGTKTEGRAQASVPACKSHN